MGEGLGGEGEHRGGETAGEEVAALGGQLGDGEAVGVRRQPLETVVETLVPEVLFAESSGDRHRASSICLVATCATPIAYNA